MDQPLLRSDYKIFYPITTRWKDNDVYGHINNVTYYSYFDTVVNKFLIENAGLDFRDAPIVGYAVHTSCNYLASIAYPEVIEAGLRVSKLGNKSVSYQIGIFKKEEQKVSAHGEFIQVYVNRAEHKSVPIPPNFRLALEKILIQSS